MIWVVGIVICFVLVVFLTAPFILSGRISREEEESGMYENHMNGDETVYQGKCDTPTEKGYGGGILEGPLPHHKKHIPLGGHSSW